MRELRDPARPSRRPSRSASSLEELLDVAADSAAGARRRLGLGLALGVGRELLRTLVNAGRLAPGEARHPTADLPPLGRRPAEAAAARGRPVVGLRRRPEPAPARALAARAARRALVRGRCRSCSATPRGASCGRRAPPTADFGERDLRLLNAIAAQVAAGIARAELYGRVTELAFSDGLTGLANRNALSSGSSSRSTRGEEVDAAAVRRRRPQGAQRRPRPSRRRLGAEGGGERAAAGSDDLRDALACRVQRRRVRRARRRTSHAETLRASVEAAIDRLAGHRPPVRLSCGIASTAIGPRAALRAAARRRRRPLRRQAQRPRPRRIAGARRAGPAALAPAARARAARAATGSRSTPPRSSPRASRLLDGPLRAAAPLERLEALATVARLVAARGGRRRLAVHARRRRTSRRCSGSTCAPAARRASARASTARATRSTTTRRPRRCSPAGGSLHLYAGDERCRPRGARAAGELGMADVLLAAAADGRGAWLLEIYGDAASADLSLADGVLRLLCDHAVRPAGGLRAERRGTAACAPCTSRRAVTPGAFPPRAGLRVRKPARLVGVLFALPRATPAPRRAAAADPGRAGRRLAAGVLRLSPPTQQPVAVPDPPRHPFMAPNGRSNLHVDGYQSDVHQGPGPLGREMERRSTFLEGVCASVTFDSRGRIETVCVGVEGPKLLLLDPRTLETLAAMPLPPRQPGGGNLVHRLRRRRLLLPRPPRPRGDPDHDAARLRRPPDERRHRLRARARPRPVERRGAGRQDHLRAAGLERAAVVRVDERGGRDRLPEDRGRALAAAGGDDRELVRGRGHRRASTSSATRRCTGSRPARRACPRSRGARRTRTPGVQKPGPGERGLGHDADADGRRPRRDHRQRGPDERARPPPRLGGARICRQPVFEKGASATDQSLIGTGTSLVVENNHGYSGPAATQGGQDDLARPRARRPRRRRRLPPAWRSGERAPSVVPKLSARNGLVYTYTKDPQPRAPTPGT